MDPQHIEEQGDSQQRDESAQELQKILEAVLLASDQPIAIDRILALFVESEAPTKAQVREALLALRESLEGRAVELVEVGNGWRLQTRQAYAGWVSRLWEEKPPRYSRALLETLALVCYRQPITRSEIEEIRGVSLSQSIIKTLMERNWVRVVGYREIPGRPELLGTTREFLDDFNLPAIESLPALPEVRDLDALAAAVERLQPSSTNEVTHDGGDKSVPEENLDVSDAGTLAIDKTSLVDLSAEEVPPETLRH